MDEIRKYSREWFVTNGTQAQRDAAKKMQNGCEDFCMGIGFFQDDTFIGTLDEVKDKVKQIDIEAAGRYQSEADRIEGYGGVENLFALIDADGDGTITQEEIVDIAAVDTDEFADVDNSKFSVKDLRRIYENVMASEGAELESADNIDTYKYQDGSLTQITRDESGKIVQKYVEQSADNNERKSTTYVYDGKIKTESIIDSQGRVRYEKTDAPGKVNDKVVKTVYNDTSKTVTTETVGRTIVETVDSEGKSKKVQTLKYHSDGKIDDTYQKDIGDCWVLSSVNALRDTTTGAQLIKDSIQHNDDGSVTVHLKGVDKSYTYSPEQIGAHEYTDKNKSYAMGDIDMNLIEMAFNDYRYELLSNTTNPRGELREASLEDPLNGGWLETGISVLTGKSYEAVLIKPQIEKTLKQKQKNPQDYSMLTSFKTTDEEIDGIMTKHAYSIKRVTKDTVYVVNPHDSSKEIAYPKDKFMENAEYITSFDLKSKKK